MKTLKVLVLTAPCLLVAASTMAQTFVPGFIRHETWINKTRAQVEAGTAGTASTDGVDLTRFEAPANTGVNNYAERLSGFFVPQVSGNYVFFVNSDDDSDLFLSTDNTTANKRLIAQETGWSNPDQWLGVGGGSTTAQKRSDSFSPDAGVTMPFASGIPLVAGSHYYIEAVMHQGTGGDNLGVNCKLIADPDPANGTGTIITNTVIGVNLVAVPTTITVQRQVQSASIFGGSEASFSFVTTNNAQPPMGAIYQWYRNGSPVAGATTTAYTFLGSLADNAAQFTCVAGFPSPISLSKTSAVATLTVKAGTTYTNGLKREFFANSDRIRVESGNVGAAASVSLISSFQLPANTGQNAYAQRITGFFIPPVTTNYVFFTSSDDDSDLYISTDSTPANKRLVAQEQNWSNPQEWVTSGGGSAIGQKRSDQFSPDGGVTVPYSAGIPLTAGQMYYLEGVMHQGGGGDNFTATYIFSGDTDPTNGQSSAFQVTNNNIWLVSGTITNVVFTTQPQNTTVFDAQTAGFSAAATSYADLAPSYQWYKNGSPITNATGTSYKFVANAATDNGAQYFVVASSAEGGINATSTVATLTVLQAVLEPGFLKVEFWSSATRANVESGNVAAPDYTTTVVTPDNIPVNDNLNNYAQRLSGLFIPPTSGNYVFFLCSDDDSDLFLSTDNTPVNKRLIAQETGWSGARNWVSVGAGSVTQKRSDTWSPDNGVTTPFASGIPLTGGQKYYLEAVMAQGGGGDDLNVTYKKTGDNDPANGDPSNLTNGTIAFNAPKANSVAFTLQPQNQSVVSANAATFTAQGTTDSAISIDERTNSFVLYQWLRAGTAIPGATLSSYTTPLTLPADNGAQFICQIRALGITTWSNSQTATLTVVTDTNVPTMLYAAYGTNLATAGYFIDLTFSKRMDATTLAQIANYTVAGVTVTGITIDTNNGSIVELDLSGPPSFPLSVTVNGLKDFSGNSIAANTSLTVHQLPVVNQDIGIAVGVADPALPAIFWADGQGAFIISAEGSDIWANNDGFNFTYELKTNDFDVVVRQKSITHTSNWAKGGLMARETLDPGSRNWNIVNDPLASDGIQAPDGSGMGASLVECNSRVATNGASGGWDTNRPAPAYPNAWVRLKRTGQLLTALVSSNGVDWTQQGTQDPRLVGDSNSLPAAIYVGICVTAHNNDVPGTLPYRYYNTSVFDSYNSSFVAATPAARLQVGLASGNNITVSWTPLGGRLQSSPQISGAGVDWQDVAAATNPMNIPILPGVRYFRVVNP